MKYSVYILYSPSRDRYYVGYSKNPDERLLEHNSGATTSTRPGMPWKLVYEEVYEDKTTANILLNIAISTFQIQRIFVYLCT